MEQITIDKGKNIGNGWKFSVVVKDGNYFIKYNVVLDEVYWKKLTGREYTPKVLIEKSFHFLLLRESKESILPSFNLKQIQDYFPEYEKEMKNSDKYQTRKS